MYCGWTRLAASFRHHLDGSHMMAVVLAEELFRRVSGDGHVITLEDLGSMVAALDPVIMAAADTHDDGSGMN